MNRSFQSQMLTLAFLLMAGVVAACGASSATQAEAPGHSEEGDHGEHGEAHRLDISTLGEEEHLRRHERHRWIHC